MWIGHLFSYTFPSIFWPLSYINNDALNSIYYYLWRYLGEPFGMAVHFAVFVILIF